LPGVAYPGVRDNRSTLNTKTGYDDDDEHITDFNLVTKSKDAVNHYSSEQSQVVDLSLTN